MKLATLNYSIFLNTNLLLILKYPSYLVVPLVLKLFLKLFDLLLEVLQLFGELVGDRVVPHSALFGSEGGTVRPR